MTHSLKNEPLQNIACSSTSLQSASDGISRENFQQLSNLPVTFGTPADDERVDIADKNISATNLAPPAYDSACFVSGASVSKGCHLRRDVIKFIHSFGYDCRKCDNLCVLDADTLMYVSGNLVHFFNVGSATFVYLRSCGGCGIAHATVHPDRTHIATAEKGVRPLAIVYNWPSLSVERVLRNGTQQHYAYITFNANGDLVCTVGGEPDYMLTVWQWRHESVLLRCRAFSQPVHRAAFSQFHSHQLVTAGCGHIRFWRMVSTFTGLKLLGEVGRFGKTQISDVHGFLQLSDGKVISGCEWGNLLLWQHGLIKLQVCRRDSRPCHAGPVHSVYLEDGELFSLGGDGWVRTWNVDTLEQAVPCECGVSGASSSGLFMMEPMNELCVQRHADLRYMVPLRQTSDSDVSANQSTDGIYMIQLGQRYFWLIWYHFSGFISWHFQPDGSGGIWRADLSFSMTAAEPRRVLQCASGGVRAIAVCLTATVFAIIADDGSVCVYNYTTRQLMARSRFPTAGTDLLWLQEKVSGDRVTLLAAFSDGCVRVLRVCSDRRRRDCVELVLVQVLKPHAAAVTVMALTPSGRTLISAGHDGTVWFFSLSRSTDARFLVVPLGFCRFIDADAAAVDIDDVATWDYQHAETATSIEFVPKSERKFVLLTSCGRVLEVHVPSADELGGRRNMDSDAAASEADSYFVDGLIDRCWTFYSVKSEILRQEAERRRNQQKDKERGSLRKSIDQRREQGMEFDADLEWMRLEQRLAAEDRQFHEVPLVLPDPPSPALIITVEPASGGGSGGGGRFQLLMDGWDGGWLYTANLRDAQPFPAGRQRPVTRPRVVPRARRIPAAADCDPPTTATVRRVSGNGRMMVLGMSDGSVRVHNCSSDEPWLLEQYWSLPMHDSENGRVTDVRFTTDDRYLLSCGADGNIFMYEVTGGDSSGAVLASHLVVDEAPTVPVDDIDDAYAACLQQQRYRAARVSRLQLSERRCANVRLRIHQLRRQYKSAAVTNQQLPESMMLCGEKLLMDRRISQRQAVRSADRVNTVIKEMAWTAEKHRLGYQQLDSKFQRGVQHLHTVVTGFRNGRCVWTQRLQQYPQQLVNELHELRQQHQHQRAAEQYARLSSLERDHHLSAASFRKSVASVSSTRSGSGGSGAWTRQSSHAAAAQLMMTSQLPAGVLTALQRMQQRRERRAQRRLQWAELYARCPYGATGLAGAEQLQQAATTLGDCRLRSSADYEPPEPAVYSTPYKRVQLLAVQAHIQVCRREMNERVLEMRQRKADVIRQYNDDCLACAARIQQKLPTHLHVPLPSPLQLSTLESPEAIYEVDEATLSAYRSIAEQSLLEHLGVSTLSSGQHSTGSWMTRSESGSVTPAAGRRRSTIVGRTVRPGSSSVSHAPSPPAQPTRDRHYPPADSPLQLMVAGYERCRLVCERDAALRRAEQLIVEFDSCLMRLWKHSLDANYRLKQAQLLMNTRFCELGLISEFEKREHELTSIVQERTSSDNEAQLLLLQVSRRLQTPCDQIEYLQRSLARLTAEVAAEVPDDKFAGFLQRVYRRKPPRRRRSSSRGDGSDCSESSASSISTLGDTTSDDSSEGNDAASRLHDEIYGLELDDYVTAAGRAGGDNDKWNLSVCPPGCSTELYDWIVLMCQERRAIEEEIEMRRLGADAIRKEQDAAVKVCRVRAAALAAAREDVRVFQLQKLRCLNELPVGLSLRQHQLQLLARAGQLPADVGQLQLLSLLVTRTEMTQLAGRVQQLLTEWSEERIKRRECVEKTNVLKQNLVLMENEIATLKSKCDESMIRKFGRPVRLELMESMAVNVTEQHLKLQLQLRTEELQQQRQQRQMRLEALRAELHRLTRDNTNHAATVHVLSQQRRRLTTVLNAARCRGVGLCDTLNMQNQDTQRLMETIALQKTQIGEMREELWRLNLKCRIHSAETSSLSTSSSVTSSSTTTVTTQRHFTNTGNDHLRHEVNTEDDLRPSTLQESSARAVDTGDVCDDGAADPSTTAQ